MMVAAGVAGSGGLLSRVLLRAVTSSRREKGSASVRRQNHFSHLGQRIGADHSDALVPGANGRDFSHSSRSCAVSRMSPLP
jgi:hypothetical protein